MTDDRQKLRREAVAVAHAHPGEFPEGTRVQNKHVLAMESIIVELEEALAFNVSLIAAVERKSVAAANIIYDVRRDMSNGRG